jgi:hypothetical protein
MERASLLTVLNAIVIYWTEKRETRNEKREFKTGQRSFWSGLAPLFSDLELYFPFSRFSFLILERT